MTALTILGIGTALFTLACLVLRAAHAGRRRNHRQGVQDAVLAMTQALDESPPQQELLREILALLAEQDRLAQGLEARMRTLLPDLAQVGSHADGPSHLDAVSDLVASLQRTSWILPEVEARVTRLLAVPEPQEAVSSFIVGTFDFSRDTLARGQFIHARDHTEPAADSPVLRAALNAYSKEVVSAGVDLFVSRSREFAGLSAELRALGSVGQAGVRILRDGLRRLPARAHGGPQATQAPGRPACDAAKGVGAVTGSPVARLAEHDVLGFPQDSPYLGEVRAYLPVFGFVADDTHTLSQLDRAWSRLREAAEGLRNEIAAPGPAGEDAEVTIMWPGVHGSPAESIRQMIGPRISSLVRARWLTWSAWDCHAALAGALAEADAAARRLSAQLGSDLAGERAAYFARIGRAPRLDTVGNRAMAAVAAQLQETSEQHVRLARALVAEMREFPVAGSDGEEPGDFTRLLAAVNAADGVIHRSRAAIAAGDYLDAVRQVLGARLPLQGGGFPGRVFHQDLLAQARPLAVLAIAHRLAIARWAALALSAYFRSGERIEEMVSTHVAG